MSFESEHFRFAALSRLLDTLFHQGDKERLTQTSIRQIRMVLVCLSSFLSYLWKRVAKGRVRASTHLLHEFAGVAVDGGFAGKLGEFAFERP